MKISKTKYYVFWIVLLTIIECSLVGYIAWWKEPFWNAVNHRQLHTFIIYIGYFTGAALLACYVSSKNQYLQKMCALNYRRILTKQALKIQTSIEGYQQRIQEDCFSYPDLSISLSLGLIKNFVMLLVFLVVLFKQLPIIYMTLPAIYAIIGTLVASKLATPLINLNYLNQATEALFRQQLTKITYARTHMNNYRLFVTTKQLSYFQYFYNQISVVIPYLILASVYFSGRITFGILMQCSSAMNSIIDCMSYFINSFNDINRWLSCRKRLKELGVI